MKSTFTCSILFTVLLLLGIVPGRALGEEAGSFRVMSFNVRYDTVNDGANGWSFRKQNVAHMIGVRYQADIIGLQEPYRAQLQDIMGYLPEYAWVGVGRDTGVNANNAGEYTPIMYRPDRFELLTWSTSWLSPTPEVHSLGWDAMFPKMVTKAKFRDKQTDNEFWFFNTHLDHVGSTARVQSAHLISAWITEATAEGIPVIVTGDFNVQPNSTAYNIIVNTSGISDAYFPTETPHQGPTTTRSGSNGWTQLSTGRIDFIFADEDVRILNHVHAAHLYGGRYPSDHIPVVSDVLIVPEPGGLGALLVGAGLTLWRGRRRHGSMSASPIS